MRTARENRDTHLVGDLLWWSACSRPNATIILVHSSDWWAYRKLENARALSRKCLENNARKALSAREGRGNLRAEKRSCVVIKRAIFYRQSLGKQWFLWRTKIGGMIEDGNKKFGSTSDSTSYKMELASRSYKNSTFPRKNQDFMKVSVKITDFVMKKVLSKNPNRFWKNSQFSKKNRANSIQIQKRVALSTQQLGFPKKKCGFLQRFRL